MMTVGLGTALGVTTLLVSIYCICTCRRRGNKSVSASVDSSRAVQSPAVAAGATTTALETLMMEACYPELQVLDALSRTVRQKKQNVHDEIIKFYGAAASAAAASSVESNSAISNVYSSEPRPSVKQVKRHRQQAQEHRASGHNVTTVVVGPTEQRTRTNNEALYWEIGHNSHPILPPTPV